MTLHAKLLRPIERIAFIGLGVMGEPMCGNLGRRGRWPVTAFDFLPDPLERLAADGVIPAVSAETAAAASDLVILCLPGGDQVRALTLGDGGLLEAMTPGATLVDMSTSPPSLMRELAASASKRGMGFADAPVARTRQAAAEGTLAIMAGAEPETFALVEPVLAAMGSDVSHCGGPGAGQVAKILNNMVLFQTVAALAEALEIAEAEGVDGAAFLEVLSKGSGDSFALRNHGRKSLAPREYPERAFSVRYAAKDLSYALDMARAGGIDAGGAERIARLFEAAEEAGHGDCYFPVIRELARR